MLVIESVDAPCHPTPPPATAPASLTPTALAQSIPNSPSNSTATPTQTANPSKYGSSELLVFLHLTPWRLRPGGTPLTQRSASQQSLARGEVGWQSSCPDRCLAIHRPRRNRTTPLQSWPPHARCGQRRFEGGQNVIRHQRQGKTE